MNTLRKTIATIVILSAIFCCIAILDYSPDDPSYFNATDKQVKNITSKYGAKISDPIIQAFGYGILIPLIISIIWAVKEILNKQVKMLMIKLSTIILTLPAFCFLLSIFDNDTIMDGEYYSFHFGGYLGYFLYSEAFFSQKFSTYILIACSICIITIAFSLGVIELIVKNIFQKNTTNEKFTIKAKSRTFYNYVCNIFQKNNLATNITKRSCNLNPDLQFKIQPETSSESKKFFDLNSSTETNTSKNHSIFPLPIQPLVEEKNNTPQMNIFGLNDTTPTPVNTKEPVLNSSFNTTPVCQKGDFVIPSTSILHSTNANHSYTHLSVEDIEISKRKLLQVLNDFGIKGEITEVFHGPIVTLYCLEPISGTKSSRVIGLSDDIARSMRAKSARVSVIQGKHSIGIELPNDDRAIINLKDLLDSDEYKSCEHNLPIALGKNIAGEIVIADLAKMPHLLVAGTTGSGKSVAIHSMILSLLYKYSPDECKFIMIDPKMLELSVYDGIPHLLAPVVTTPETAIATMKWVVKEMSTRYRLMSNLGVRNIISYNTLIREAQSQNANIERQVQTGFDNETKQPIFESIVTKAEILPYIVVIIDEMADLMLVAGKDIENSVQRLAQMARAAGIHLIMATQRPSVDIITGVIKANFPTRISFQVASKFDSRTILGEIGAEQLLGAGDMLYMMPGGKIERVHGAYVHEKDIEEVVRNIKSQREANYLFSVIESKNDESL